MVLDVSPSGSKSAKLVQVLASLSLMGELSVHSRIATSQAPTSPAVFAPYRNKLFNNILQNLNERGGGLYVGNDHGTSNQCSDVINNELGVGLITATILAL